MWVAVDEENKQVYGPFSDSEKAVSWAMAYAETVEDVVDLPGYVQPTGLDREEFLQSRLWNVQEVQFVDEDDRLFEDFLGKASPAASLAEINAMGVTEGLLRSWLTSDDPGVRTVAEVELDRRASL